MTTRARGVPRAVLVLVFAAGLLHAVAYAVTFPPWAVEDEQQHVDYVWKLAVDHRLPNLDDTIDDEIVEGVARADRWDAYGLPRPEEVTAQGMGLEGRSYTAYHPPVGYLALAPVAVAAGSDPIAVLYALRLATAVAAGAICVLTALLAARWWGRGPRQAGVALAAGLATAALPALAEVGGRVNTDVLAALAVVAGVLVLDRWTERPSRGRAWAAGSVLAAAVLTRETTVVLAVPALVALLVVHAREELHGRDLARILAPPVVAEIGWAVVTRISTGQFDGSEAFLDRYAPANPADDGARFANGIGVSRVLLPFGHWSVPLPLLLVVPVVVVAGLVLAARAGRVLPVVVAVGMLLGQIVILAVNVDRGLSVVSARLVVPSYPVVVAAAVLGWASLRRWTATFVPAAAAVALGLWFFCIDFVTRFPPRIG